MTVTHDTRKPSLADLDVNLMAHVKVAEEREGRINSYEVEATDCAMSMWASDASLSKINCQRELALAGWKHEFHVLYRHGARVAGNSVATKFGWKWMIAGEWFPTYGVDETPRKAKNFKDKGFTWVKETIPAHVAQSFGTWVGAPIHVFVVPDERNIITV